MNIYRVWQLTPRRFDVAPYTQTEETAQKVAETFPDVILFFQED